MAFNLNSCANTCLNCIKNYKKKHTLKKGQEFEIRCRGIPNEYVGIDLDEKDKMAARSILDPVSWAAENLDWHCIDPDGEIWKRKNPDEYNTWKEENPGKDISGYSRYHRPYQATMLRCSSKRKVFRIGRQCLTGDTYIHLQDGSLKQLKDIKVNDTISSMHESHRLQNNTISNFVNQQDKEVFLLKTKFGHTIKSTSDHKFYSARGHIDNYHGTTIDKLPKQWMSLDDGLKLGDKIATVGFINTFGNKSIGSLALLLGYFLTDGSCSVKQLQHLGLTNIRGPDKFIPECIFTAPKEEIRQFLNRFWSGDGYVSTFQRTGCKSYRTEIGTLQESLLMLQQLQQLLYRFGCHSCITEEGNCYRLVISDKYSIQNFLQQIGPIFDKEEDCNKALKNLKNLSDCFVNTTEDVLWDYITSIEPAGKEIVYDIEVENDHTFIANGLIVENCGKTESLVISILYNMYIKPGVNEDEGFKVIVITPYQAQIDLIFTRLKQLIKGSTIAQNSIRRDVKAPIYTLELHNNSICRGFTAGTKSGGNAEAVRGQTGHMLVFDEADYLSAGDMDAAMSIITNYPNATLWMSSTPSGKRERFYSTCLSKRFKEYHFSSQINPMWNEHLESDFREALTDIGYKHEVEANFGEQEEGVFQNVYVQAARSDYKYGDIARQNTWTYTMGVDWNDTANGTTINILGFDPSRNKFIIVDRKVVSREGWTQLSAMQKITELNRVWRPIAIYVDMGYGSTQIELLRQYGFQSLMNPEKGATHPDSKLREIIKGYDFGSKVETRDPFTKQKINKPAKPFLVESTVRRFEAGDILFSEHDTSLENQLLGYIIDRVTQSGTPVYKAGNESAGDHALDALMLSVLAFVMEITPIGAPTFDVGIGFSGQFGEKIDPEIYEGDTVVYNRKPKDEFREQRERTRPDGGRDRMTKDRGNVLNKNDELPANHTQYRNNEVGLWAWEGFSRDAPKPLTKNKNNTRTLLSPRRSSRPTRKNI